MSEGFRTLSEKVWDAYHATDRRSFSQRLRRLWEWGRMIYRVTAFSYGAFSVYENPWLVRALLAALWTACRMLLRAGTGLPI